MQHPADSLTGGSNVTVTQTQDKLSLTGSKLTARQVWGLAANCRLANPANGLAGLAGCISAVTLAKPRSPWSNQIWARLCQCTRAKKRRNPRNQPRFPPPELLWAHLTPKIQTAEYIPEGGQDASPKQPARLPSGSFPAKVELPQSTCVLA